MLVEVYTPYVTARFDIPETHETIPLVLSLMVRENSHRQDYLSLHGYSWVNSLTTLDTPLFPLSSTVHTTIPHYVGDARYERAQLLEGVVYHVLKDSPPVPWYGDVIRGMHS